MSRIRTAAVALTATGLVLAGGAATAASKSAKDKSGDAAQVADITRVTVDNDDDALSIKVKLAKAKAGRTDLVATLTTPTEGGTTYVARTVVLPPKGNSHAKKIGATLETVAGEGAEPTPVECDGIKATLSSGRQGQSSIRIPQACLGDDAGTLLVDVVTATPAGEIADEVPVTLRVKQG
jgi:hypothetical protein